jgi:hypothetical protein
VSEPAEQQRLQTSTRPKPTLNEISCGLAARLHLMLRCCCILLLVPTLIGQAGSQNNKAAWDFFYAEQAKIRQRGTDAFERERSRSKAHLCERGSNSEQGGAGIAKCLADEARSTDQNYLTYVQSIGALLRLPTPDDAKAKAPQRLSFDAAENSWRKYRDQGCAAMATQWVDVQSSTANVDCHLRLTWNHMIELDSLYGDLWHWP